MTRDNSLSFYPRWKVEEMQAHKNDSSAYKLNTWPNGYSGVPSAAFLPLVVQLLQKPQNVNGKVDMHVRFFTMWILQRSTTHIPYHSFQTRRCFLIWGTASEIRLKVEKYPHTEGTPKWKGNLWRCQTQQKCRNVEKWEHSVILPLTKSCNQLEHHTQHYFFRRWWMQQIIIG